MTMIASNTSYHATENEESIRPLYITLEEHW